MDMVEIKDLLKINQLVNIELVSENQQKSRRYASRIENFEDGPENNLVCLATPMEDRLPIFIPPGSAINIWFWDSIAIYCIPAVVLQNKVGNLYQIVLAADLTKMRRVQNRQFVRVNYCLDVSVSYLNKEGEKMSLQTKSKDLSGGGISLFLTEKNLPFEEECSLVMQFKLEELLLDLSGVVIWINREIDCNGQKRTVAGVNFTCISEELRKMIIRTVYLRQIALRSKGLL